MGDLAVTAHQHPKVALAARPNSSGTQAEAMFAFSLKQLLQGGVFARHPHATELLRAEQKPRDHEDGAAGEIAELSRKRLHTRRQEMIDKSRDADAAMPVQQMPVQQETDYARPASADSHDARYPGERVDRREANPPAASVEAQAAIRTADTGMPVNAVPPSPRQGTAAPVPAVPGLSPPLLAGAAEPVMTAPASGQPAASIIQDADILVSQSSAALAPTAALAAEQFQGQGHRLRPTAPSGSPVGAASGPAGRAQGGGEGPIQPASETAARLDANGRPMGPQAAAGAVIAGTADPGATAAAAGVPAAQGQNAAMTAATGTTALPSDKTLAAPSAATTSDARGPGGIAEGPVLGGTPAAQQTMRAAGAPARTDPFQQRIVGDQVSVHIKKAVQEGTDRIEIRLKPEALGRVDVRLELGPEGRVVATVTADQRHTLELLRSDARNLERALQEAGLQTDSGSLNFNLRSGGDDRPGRHDGGHPAAAPLPAESSTDGEGGQTAPPSGFGRAAARPDGIDIHA